VGAGIEGVFLNELHCPTCGERFRDYRLYRDSAEELFSVDAVIADIKVAPVNWRQFLRCPQGHKWTVKTIWRCRSYPDRIQLGEYLGDAP
jgi:hypothetical protein